MKRLLVLLLLLAACKEETAAAITPVEMTAETLGYYCQMNVLEHPGPKAQIHLEGLPGAPLFFSQVRDAIAYTRMPEQSHVIQAIFVNDMGAAPSWDNPGTGNWVPLDQVVFVVGSEAKGGMDQAETVPFTDPTRAESFAASHGGQVMALADIPDSVVLTEVVTEPKDSLDVEDYTTRLRNLTQKAGG